MQYFRPETGDWRDLQRRTALSQGEQKVLCYLPLFAAAAAHFASVAGAAPYAPRFVLLDDAFPKIDARTHPLLFGLLVDLDLDFVITSERLWGCHATVPELAIYEALRDPGERGIAQFQHRWDGHQLTRRSAPEARRLVAPHGAGRRLEPLGERLEGNGRLPQGRVSLADPDRAERHALGDLLGRRWPATR